jgi:hypothetical protein
VNEERENTYTRHHSSPPRGRKDQSLPVPGTNRRYEENIPTQETVPAAMRSSITFGVSELS